MPKEDPIIQVKHLSKRYQIGMDRTYKTFCETAVDTIKSPLKRLKSFSKQEETFWALKDINFEVYPGEVVGIIGRNGAGKTTLLKILSRITYPTEGEIFMRGRVGSLLEVGTGFHPELTGRENIFFNGVILGMTKSEIEDKFDEIVKFAEIEQFLDTPVKRYSSGMSVRLAFAVAAHLEPEILMVDEVLAVGDFEFQKKCLDKMKVVTREGRTVLFVSHNMGAIRNLCQKCIWLEEGKISAILPAAEAVQSYLLSGTSHSAEVVLEPKSNLKAQFIRIRLLTPRGEVADQHAIEEPIQVELTVLSRERIRGLYCTLSLQTLDGISVLFAEEHDTDLTEQLGQVGTHTFVAVIPGKILAPNEFILNVAINTRLPQRQLHQLPGICRFRLNATQSARKNWPRCFVAPELEWKLSTTSSSACYG